jgi:hypothetical protein
MLSCYFPKIFVFVLNFLTIPRLLIIVPRSLGIVPKVIVPLQESVLSFTYISLHTKEEDSMARNYLPANDAEFDHWLSFAITYTEEKWSGDPPAWNHIPRAARTALANRPRLVDNGVHAHARPAQPPGDAGEEPRPREAWNTWFAVL